MKRSEDFGSATEGSTARTETPASSQIEPTDIPALRRALDLLENGADGRDYPEVVTELYDIVVRLESSE